MKNNATITLHGVFLDIAGTGVLLTGESGSGKSELALGLIRQGHRLIADDSVDFCAINNILMGTCPPLLQDFLAIRDIGIINVKQMFGAQAICSKQVLQLIIKLVPYNKEGNHDDPLQHTQTMQTFFEIMVPEQPLMITPNRNLMLLIETIVHNQQLKQKGYDANAELTARHYELLDRSALPV